MMSDQEIMNAYYAHSPCSYGVLTVYVISVTLVEMVGGEPGIETVVIRPWLKSTEVLGESIPLRGDEKRKLLPKL